MKTIAAAFVMLTTAALAQSAKTDPTTLPSWPEFMSLATHVQDQKKEFDPLVAPYQTAVNTKNKEAQEHIDEIEGEIKALRDKEAPFLSQVSTNTTNGGAEFMQKLKDEGKVKEWLEYQNNLTALNNRWAVIRQDAGLAADYGFSVDTLSVVPPKQKGSK